MGMPVPQVALAPCISLRALTAAPAVPSLVRKMFASHHINRWLAPLLLGAALSLAAAPAATAGEGVAEPVVRALADEGYTVTDIRRTWLGRILITATNDRFLREVALDRRTGAILGDQQFRRSDPAETPDDGTPAGNGGTGQGSGAGQGGAGGSGDAGGGSGGGAGNGG